jgi:hypothetical protein
MPFLITKSLFVDYRKFPKLAWLRVNDTARYRKATKTESDDMQEYIMELWKTVEKLVGEHFVRKHGLDFYNAFPDIPEEDSWRSDDDDTWVAEMSFRDRLTQNLARTRDAIERWEKIIYQPGFQIEDCYVRWDYLVLNEDGRYDLIEVKAKSSVRKKMKDNGEDRKIGKIEDEFLLDVAFQKYIINQVLRSMWQQEIDKIFIAHVNSDYVRHGAINIDDIVSFQDIWGIRSISVIQNSKPKNVSIDDSLETETNIQAYIDLMRTELVLPEEDFWVLHPFPGNKYLEYFGADKPFGTIYSIPIHHSRAPLIAQAARENRIDISALSQEELRWIGTEAGNFIDKYFRSEREPCIEETEIVSGLTALQFPICFYDYESVSTPIPLLDWISPYQQAVVQYSLHKLFADGHIEHYWAVLVWEWELQITDVTGIDDPNIELQKNRIVIGNQKDFLQLFLADIGNHLNTSSFVVWYKPFENSRNKEIGESYADLEDSFLKINDMTYDLYDPFSEYKYFDRRFQGSASIKKVLPVLVPGLSYEHLNIGKWDKAMNKLAELIRGDISDTEDRIQTAKDLLIYCRQDSWAMVEIYKKLLS